MSNEQHPGLPVNPSDLRSGARGTGQETLSELQAEMERLKAAHIPCALTEYIERLTGEKHAAQAEAAQLRELREADWPVLNRERGLLIDKRIAGTLTREESIHLEALQAYADKHLELTAPRPSLPELPETHSYTSTACHHGLHDRCRQRCKFCDIPCRCECHLEPDRLKPSVQSRVVVDEDAKGPQGVQDVA